MNLITSDSQADSLQLKQDLIRNGEREALGACTRGSEIHIDMHNFLQTPPNGVILTSKCRELQPDDVGKDPRAIDCRPDVKNLSQRWQRWQRAHRRGLLSDE